MNKTTNTPVLEFSEPSQTMIDSALTEQQIETLWRTTLAFLYQLYYMKHRKRVGYRVKIYFQEVEE